MPRITSKRLRAFASAVIEATGTPADAASVVADHLVESNLTGHDSHGALRLPQYHEHAALGHVRPAARPELRRETAVTALVDGGHGWGPPVAGFATDLAVAKAQRSGLAAVTVRGCYHVGRVGVYPARAAHAGLIGIAWCNVHGGVRVAPWGGGDCRLGTNPIAVAVPTDGAPIVADLATSAVAEGKVRKAMLDGLPIPHGWVFDADGQSTADPHVLYGDGTLASLGGAQGHKGYSLAVAADLLGGVLAASGCGAMVDGYGNGLLLLVLDPAAFGDPQDFRRRVAEYVAYIKSSRTLEGVEAILLPGEIEARTRAERLRTGLWIDDGVWGRLVALADELDIELAADLPA